MTPEKPDGPYTREDYAGAGSRYYGPGLAEEGIPVHYVAVLQMMNLAWHSRDAELKRLAQELEECVPKIEKLKSDLSGMTEKAMLDHAENEALKAEVERLKAFEVGSHNETR